MVRGDNTSKEAKMQPPRMYYDADMRAGYCVHCDKQYQPSEQKMYTTKNGKRTYGICPNVRDCGDKRPLRKRPHKRVAWLTRYPPKYIE